VIDIDDDLNKLSNLEIHKLNMSTSCLGSSGNFYHLYQVKFTSIHTDNEMLFKVSVNLDGVGIDWSIRRIIFEGIFCKSDCLSCSLDADICSRCDSSMLGNAIKQGNDCKC
jgi:hypothetical protein